MQMSQFAPKEVSHFLAVKVGHSFGGVYSRRIIEHLADNLRFVNFVSVSICFDLFSDAFAELLNFLLLFHLSPSLGVITTHWC